MSRKSRQHAAAQRMKHVLPTGIALFVAIAGLILGMLMAMPRTIVTKEEAVTVTAVLSEVESIYRSSRYHRYLHSIRLLFEDHDQLSVDTVNVDEELLAELSALPAGTVCDMFVQPEGITVLALSVDGKEIIAFEETISRFQRGNRASSFLSLPFFGMGAYGLRNLAMRWRYRQV